MMEQEGECCFSMMLAACELTATASYEDGGMVSLLPPFDWAFATVYDYERLSHVLAHVSLLRPASLACYSTPSCFFDQLTSS